MSSWITEANQQEREQRNEDMINKLRDSTIQEQNDFSTTPPLGGYGRGKKKTLNGVEPKSPGQSSGDPRTFAGFGGFVGASLKQTFTDRSRQQQQTSAKAANSSLDSKSDENCLSHSSTIPVSNNNSHSSGSFGEFGDASDTNNKSAGGFGGGSFGSGFGGGGGFGGFDSGSGGKSRGGGSNKSDFGSGPSPSTFQEATSSFASAFGDNATNSNSGTVNGTTDEEQPDKPQSKEEESYLNKILHDKLVDITTSSLNIEGSRKDPNSPLYSIKSFEELHLRQELLDGVAAMGFTFPSKIQEAALPMLLADPPQNMIAQSQSGTGKTAAFVLCMLSRVDPKIQAPQCLCLAPTFELALQIGKVAETMGKFCKDIKVKYAVRSGSQEYRLKRNELITEQILIGTSGTSLDWLVKYKAYDPKFMKVFVLDEADIMISQQGQQDQSIRLNSQFPSECQRLLFSATYDPDVMEFAEKIITDPIVITVRRQELPLNNIKQYYVECRNKEEKLRSLCNLYGSLTIGQSMIFCATKQTAKWLAGEMTGKGHSVSLLSSELDIDQRTAVINRFKHGSDRVLISTNVCARGIDVEQVTVVVNFDVPITVDRQPDFETYLHRIGRTGRFGKAGLAINYVDGPRTMDILRQIEQYFEKKIEKLDTEDFDAMDKIENRT